MNKTQEFFYEKSGAVRIVEINKVTCFVATDIARISDYKNTEGLYHMNMAAWKLKTGRNSMLSYPRGKEVMFCQDNCNVPYQRFLN